MRSESLDGRHGLRDRRAVYARRAKPHEQGTGLIQFMPATAKSLGMTISQLAAMTAVEQLDVVEEYRRAERRARREP